MTEVEEYADLMVRGGFVERDEVVEAVVDSFPEEVSEQDAEALVERLWAARLSEQAGWPAETETDRLMGALAELDDAGVVARANFTCCNTCGTTEIGAEADENSRGYVFFHQQDTERAAEGGGLYLAFGTFGAGDAAAVGREVVAALEAAGLRVQWNGSPTTRILVTPLTWQVRLE